MRRRQALLVAPPLGERTYPGKPMALDYLATVLRSLEWHVLTIDADVVGLASLRDVVGRSQPDLVGVTAMSAQVDDANDIARLVRSMAPQAAIVRGGPHDTFGYEECVNTHQSLFDAHVVGDGLETLGAIASAVERGTFLDDRADIAGLAWWDGRCCTSRPADRINIESFRASRLFHHPRYDFDVFKFAKTAQVLGARGCANACYYCSESCEGDRRHEERRFLGSFRREFAELAAQGYRAVYFDDSTFTRDRAWVAELCTELRRWRFSWGCNTRVDLLDEELVAYMHASGCQYLFCGFESAVPEVLLAMNKTPDPQHYLEAARRTFHALARADVPCSAFLIFGCPRRDSDVTGLHYTPERERDVTTSLRFAIYDLDPDYLSMNILRFLPGTPFSRAPQFAGIRPGGGSPIHGGHYDAEWYSRSRRDDMRSAHPIYRAFEGCGSINPPQMTPERCYAILSEAIDLLNSKNSRPGARQTKLVIDKRFSRYILEDTRGAGRALRLAPMSCIAHSAPWQPRRRRYHVGGGSVAVSR